MKWVFLLLASQISLASSIEIESGPTFTRWKPKGTLPNLDRLESKALSPVTIPKFHSPTPKVTPDININPISTFKSFTPSPLKVDSLPPSPALPTAKPFKDQQELAINELSSIEYKFLQAELFFDSKQYELALGLYLDLRDEDKLPNHDEVTFRLAETAVALDLYNDFKKWSLELIANSKYRDRVYANLTQKIRSYDEQLIGQLEPIEKKHKLTPAETALQYRLLKAQHLSKQDKLKEALELLEIANSTDPLLAKVTLLKGVLLYRLGKLDQALGALEPFISTQSETLSFELKNESYLLLARLYFQKGEYQSARNYYSRVDQNYIEWLPAMTELGWAQILQGDYEGASGNMFSLHTEFFKNHFIPDSYLARTVGYLGLCQYGDALKTVVDLKSRYSPLVEKTRQIKDDWSHNEFYELVPTALSNPKQAEVKGVPRAWISFLTRDPNFIREQQIINSLEDEINSYNRFTLKIINLEKENTKKKQDLLKKSSLSDTQKDDLYWTSLKLHIYKKSREHVRGLRAEGFARITEVKGIHKQAAGLALKQKMVDTHKDLLVAFEQVDLLQYEIFSGAGEQLRSVLSGLPIDPRSFASERSSKDPVEVKWDFKGEVWKDEIGYFRSSLKNICGESEPIRAASQEGDSQ